MYNCIPDHMILARIRWRLAMLVLHLVLFLASIAVVIAMFLPTVLKGATTQYYLVLMMVGMVALYGLFGLIVYYRCRFLLRVLAIASAIILGVILFHFIMSYISSIACRFDENHQRQIILNNCTAPFSTDNQTIKCRK